MDASLVELLVVVMAVRRVDGLVVALGVCTR